MFRSYISSCKLISSVVTYVLECKPGQFGAGCKGVCLCQNNSTCNATTGACICAPGWRGLRCERPCPDGRYGSECAGICNCSSSGIFFSNLYGCFHLFFCITLLLLRFQLDILRSRHFWTWYKMSSSYWRMYLFWRLDGIGLPYSLSC